jgi:isobutyryl-CoA mutase
MPREPAPSSGSPRILRAVTAASLFDGHDASINIIRRILQAAGVEVIHLGHNRSVADMVEAGIQEDVHAICLSSYQGGHMEFFKYMKDMLVARGTPWIRIFGGGGGVIVPDEMRELHAYGITRIYHAEDGRRMGLKGIIDDMVARCDQDLGTIDVLSTPNLLDGNILAVTRAITLVENGRSDELPPGLWAEVEHAAASSRAVVIGFTGTGGAGKSSLTDEIVRRYRTDHPGHRVAILAVDPTRKRTGGALLGDRIRMNSIHSGPESTCFMRSFATRGHKGELSIAIHAAVQVCKAAGFDLIFIETSGIGQGDSDITEHTDLSFYVMTPEYGASGQLEKIDMLDFADAVILNKFERHGGEDALRDIRKQVRRNREAWTEADDALPVFATIASQFNDPGVNAFYHFLLGRLDERSGTISTSVIPSPTSRSTHPHRTIIPPHREKYLGEIVTTVRDYKKWADTQVRLVRRIAHVHGAAAEMQKALDRIGENGACGSPETVSDPAPTPIAIGCLQDIERRLSAELDPRASAWLQSWPQTVVDWSGDEFVYKVRDREIRQPIRHESLSHQMIPKISLPRYEDEGDLLRWGLLENLPGHFPYTAGVFPLKRSFEDPKRMFAGEGGPARTNARFHYLCAGEQAKRLSTAFDSVTLYGQDPDERPDIWGKVGESGVSVPHLDDMKILYSGFDLLNPLTSVSMTINGPAPILLAMFFNTAIDQQLDQFRAEKARDPSAAEREAIRTRVFENVRGTVQADILKEDQGQNTCIFSTEFALRMMGDIQEFFIKKNVRNYYSVSISGYHIAEAGANPVSQLAFTLANGLTYVEYYLARGMAIDDFAPNLSFFFSVGLEPEYTVLGRVARRIWAVVVDRKYGGDSRSQKLKYHIQTSGRSLHAREIQFNDIRTTLQALLAWYDHCNSLHTNAYDEAVTTPTEESVRRAMAVQLIISKEFGLTRNENPLQGAFIVEELTELVEEAVLDEFERIDRRGGVLGAMETQYQRSRIQEESLYYEHKKHDGSYPIVGINTFQDPNTLSEDWEPPRIELRRSTPEEKDGQIVALRIFQAAHADETSKALARLQEVATAGGNIFEELLSTVRVASLGQITHALFEVGGEYRRNL